MSHNLLAVGPSDDHRNSHVLANPLSCIFASLAFLQGQASHNVGQEHIVLLLEKSVDAAQILESEGT